MTAPGLRIAMVLPEPRHSGGVPGTGRVIALGLARLGHRVDAYTVLDDMEKARLLDAPNVRVHGVPTGFTYGSWYTRHALLTHVIQLLTRAVASWRVARALARAHAREPYDVVYRFSTIELLGLGSVRRRLPPIVVHPEVHAAGELDAVRRERPLARRCEPWYRRAVIESLLVLRARRQQHALRRVAGVIAPSRVFAEHLVADTGVPRAIVSVAPNPVDLEQFSPDTTDAARTHDGPWRLVFVGRISVRKGIDDLVALSHRLDDLVDRVRLQLVGSPSLWSDYRPLLAGLNPRIATATAHVHHTELAALLRGSHVLIQPSTYEPFAITVAEGLASGLAVVATSEVGAAEEVDPGCCTVVEPGDVDGLELAVRDLVRRLDAGEGPALATCARAEAERLFPPSRACDLIATALAVATRAPGSP